MVSHFSLFLHPPGFAAEILSVLKFIFKGLPDEDGRVQILHIHTSKMRENNVLSSDIDFRELAQQTKNFTGAEIEGLVRAAQSTAMNRFIKV